MNKAVLKIFAVLMGAVMLLSACTFSSGTVIGSVESGTKTSWNQSHYLLNGTKSHALNFGRGEQDVEIEVVTEEGCLDITVLYSNGEPLLEIKNAETGTYDFIADGKVKISITGDDHRGSVSVKRKDS